MSDPDPPAKLTAGGKHSADINPEVAALVLETLNGDTFTTNEAGEQESYRETERVMIADDTTGAASNAIFIVDEADIDSDDTPQIAFTMVQAVQFMLDQFLHLRVNCRIGTDRISDASMVELCLLRFLSYKNRLISCSLDKDHYHVKYNDAQLQILRDGTELLCRARNDPRYNEFANVIITWMNDHGDGLKDITKNFTNGVLYPYLGKGQGQAWWNTFCVIMV